jgi:DNA-binding beta-propeller fold protein YncE
VARTWFRYPGAASTLLLAIIAVGPVAGGAGFALSARELDPAVALSPDLRPAYTLRGYSPSDRFSAPEGIAIDARHRILYVADTGKGRVVGFSLQGLPKFLLKPDGVSAPRDLAVDEQGRLYVADKETPTITVLDAQGKTVRKLDLTPLGAPRIRGLAVDRQGRLFIGDQVSAQVLICDPEGQELSRIGTRGEQRGQMKMLEDVALDRAGRVYVVDSVGTPVNVFDPGGRFIFRFGRLSPQEEDLRGPAALAIDRHDQLWVADEVGHAVQVYDGRGFRLRRFGGDSPEAALTFLFPTALVLDESGKLYVVCRGTDQVQVFSLSNSFQPFRP